MSKTIVPFASPAAKRASEVAHDKHDDPIAAITQILQALEGMQTQAQALTDLVIAQDKRIEKLEKAGKPKIIRGLVP